MIVFLTVCYVALIWILVRIGILKPTLFVKLSPLLWALFLFVCLFIPMQFSAPAGNAVVFQPVTQLTSRVSGRVEAPLPTPNQIVEKGSPIVHIEKAPYEFEVARLRAALDDAKQQVKELNAAWEASKKGVDRALATKRQTEAEFKRVAQLIAQQAASQSDLDKARKDLEVAVASVAEAKAIEEKTRLQAESNVTEGKEKGQNTRVAQLEAQLKKALYDLEQTTIVAPEDGYVTNLQLREGTAISVFAGNPMLTFVPVTERYVVASIGENYLRNVRPGDPVEMAMRVLPGKILKGRVIEVIEITGEGQISPSGKIPSAAEAIQSGGKFAVKIGLDEKYKELNLPIGSSGQVAIYTEFGQPTHIIRRVMQRMKTWLNYVW